MKVVTSLLKAGIPLNKVDCLRDILEEHAFSLSASTNLRQLVPFVLENELNEIKRSISGKPVGVIFDGTTHVCEAFVVVLRYVDDWVIKQKVCRMMLLAKSLTGEEVARQLITCLSTELSIPQHLVVSVMRDRASVNSVAMRTIGVLYTQMLEVGCFSHTLDHVGEHMKTPVLDEFTKAWICLFSHSAKTRLAWRTQTQLRTPSYSATRWWSKYEVIRQIHDAFGDVSTFLRGSDLPTATTSKILAILDDPAKCRKLKMELTLTVDSMDLFVKSTYNLEGDGPLVLCAYEQISALFLHISTAYYPNVNALARELSQGVLSREQQLLAYARECVTPAYTYFKEKFENDLKPVLDAFKAARFFNPSKVNELKPTATDIDSLESFPFLKQQLSDLKLELPQYLAAAEDVSPRADPITWWKSHEDDLPHWGQSVKLVLLVQPSSAAAERVFSLLANSFSDRQESSLEDYIQASVMMQ